MMPKGNFDINHYNEQNNVVEMKGWITPTLQNLGTADIDIEGITVPPGKTFVLGPQGVKMEGKINLKFGEGSKKAAVAYVTTKC